ncbi:UDP-4-amino-4,6-dideoxy-N-acetyl-beta-L-altrosamine N-acetyltransferase [Paenibacillus sp. YYML68]|uniref:UDP-4-amino-4, 6-dideoxy-N-acetyl-beta-L-altrosamine N-acetyltransferase n=1 Tax=Paenibacillus sp. YYML68 TaxID=2909250 RepID=UPI0024909F90|nr:UDP-4-amino-4,6-dideoxy-N-acetyl-beta-L-altrosamine N-acetyltransferase [Paenibacillus sp. YYML68]
MEFEKSCELRPVSETDLLLLFQWRNSHRVQESMYSDQAITLDQHTTWFHRMLQRDDLAYYVFEYNGVPSGVVNFVQLDKINGKCSWGFYLGADDLPAGTGTKMCRLGLRKAFEELQMRKICGEAFAFNLASVKVHEKLGFQREGYYKEHVFKNGRYEDIVAFALFRDDFMSGERIADE